MAGKDTPKAPVPPQESDEKDDAAEDWTGEPSEPETEPAKDLTEVAKQVLAGEWGSGQERRIALANEGYDPNKVQAEVVRILNE